MAFTQNAILLRADLAERLAAARRSRSEPAEGGAWPAAVNRLYLDALVLNWNDMRLNIDATRAGAPEVCAPVARPGRQGKPRVRCVTGHACAASAGAYCGRDASVRLLRGGAGLGPAPEGFGALVRSLAASVPARERHTYVALSDRSWTSGFGCSAVASN